MGEGCPRSVLPRLTAPQLLRRFARKRERNEFRSTTMLANPFAVLVICTLNRNSPCNTRTTDVWQPPC